MLRFFFLVIEVIKLCHDLGELTARSTIFVSLIKSFPLCGLKSGGEREERRAFWESERAGSTVFRPASSSPFEVTGESGVGFFLRGDLRDRVG